MDGGAAIGAVPPFVTIGSASDVLASSAGPGQHHAIAARLGEWAMPNAIGPVLSQNAVVELRVQISPAGLLSIAAIVLAGAVVTGVAIREARRPVPPRPEARR